MELWKSRIAGVLLEFQCAGVMLILQVYYLNFTPFLPDCVFHLLCCRLAAWYLFIILMIMIVIVLIEHHDSITMFIPYDSRLILTTINFNCDYDLDNLHYQTHHYHPCQMMMMIMTIRSAVRNPLAGKRALRLPLASHHMVTSLLQISLSSSYGLTSYGGISINMIIIITPPSRTKLYR